MTTKAIIFKNFNEQNPYYQYFITFDNSDTYIFTVRWNDYCKCAFLSITDYNDNPIITGKALVNNLVIRNNKLPYTLYFIHTTEATYEPNIDILADEYILAYEDENESESE